MRLYEIPPIMEAIADAFAKGEEPDIARVNLLIQDGPKAIESWVEAIDEARSDAEVIAQKIKELRGRMEARTATADRMANMLRDILDNHFEGKLKTPLMTVWNQESVSYDFDRVPVEYYTIPEPKVDKKKLLEDYREGKLPKSIEVIERKTKSIRIRR